MMLFKFDIKYVRFNFKTIASMKFNFDLNLILMWSRNYVWFKWNVKNSYWKNLKKLQFLEFRSIKNSLRLIECPFRSIKQELRIDRVNPRLCDNFLQFFDRSKIPFDRSDLPFDWLNMNRESIESSRNFEMNLLNILIDREIPSIDRMNCFLKFLWVLKHRWSARLYVMRLYMISN